MPRDSRFDKLEQARPTEAKAEPHADEGRFLEAPMPTAPLPEFAEPPAPAPSLARFEEDGGEGVRLDRSELTELPMIRCAACGANAGKFEHLCATCHARLDTPETIALNVRLLEELRQAQRDEATARAEAQRRALAESLSKRQLTEDVAKELRKDLGAPMSVGVRALLLFAASSCLFGCFAVPWFGVKIALFLVFVVLLAIGVPPSAWRVLGTPSRPP